MKNRQKMHKRIFGVVFFAILLYVTMVGLTVYAKCKNPIVWDKLSKEEQQKISNDMLGRYNIKLSIVDGNNGRFKLTMNPEDKTDQRCSVHFKIIDINGNPSDKVLSSSDRVLSCGPAGVVFDANVFENKRTGLPGVVVTLVAENIVDSENTYVDDQCTYNKVEITTEISYVPTEKITTANCPTVSKPKIEELKSHYVDCDNKTYDAKKNPFEYEFCDVRKKAMNVAGRDYTGKTATATFKCNHDLTTLPKDFDQKEGDEYFINKQYLYKKEVTSTEVGYYTNEYVPGHIVKSDPIMCKRTCEETVVVEYGPPVAAVAGMCFEYKVRVTSRVVCTPDLESILPPSQNNCNYYTPKPTCSGREGTFNQGGPNEDFDQCIQSCDGGKYTKKCSNKCYKQVYGSSSTAGAKTQNEYTDIAATRLSLDDTVKYCIGETSKKDGETVQYLTTDGNKNGTPYNYTGCYVFSSGTIVWKSSYRTAWVDASGHHNQEKKPSGNAIQVGGSSSGYQTGSGISKGNEGRWYSTSSTGSRWYANGGTLFFLNWEDGFWRKYHGGDNEKKLNYCYDDCTWGLDSCNSVQSCSENKIYINSGYPQRDYKKNWKIYEEAVNACAAQASCSEKQSTFTISTMYQKDKWINFPYKDQKDTAMNANGIAQTTAKNKNTTLLPNYPKDKTGLLGCYGGYDTRPDLYRSTWGFPSSWKNLKTNEVSYNITNGNNAWYEFPHQFCLPEDMWSVNVKWWNAYYRSLSNTYDTTSLGEMKWHDNTCFYAGTTTNNSIFNTNYQGGLEVPESDITYNIKANTENFGYFKWNITMKCFYALNNYPILDSKCDPTKNNSKKCETDGLRASNYRNIDLAKCTTGYKIRTIDLGDMFPDEDGTPLSSPTTTGRQTGVNWSKFGSTYNNERYPVDPVKIYSRIQTAASEARSAGRDVYNDDNLDYQFTLMPEDLRRLRKDAAGSGGSNYTAFENGEFYVDSFGVSRYSSNLIHKSSIEKKAPNAKTTATMCNDMINYANQDSCNRD